MRPLALPAGDFHFFFARKPLRLSLLYLSYYLHCMYLYELRHAHLRRARACPVVAVIHSVSAPLALSALELKPSALRPPRLPVPRAGRPCCRCTCALLNCEHRGSL